MPSMTMNTLSALHGAIDEAVGVKLFTVLRWNLDRRSLLRIYSSDAVISPVGVEKGEGVSAAWVETCVARRRPYLGRTPTDVRAVFDNWQALSDIGCGCVINIPISNAGSLVGILNLLEAPSRYDEATLDRVVALVEPHAEQLAHLIRNAAGDN